MLGLFLALCSPHTNAASADSLRYNIISLDSLNEEDRALLEEYRDSFLLELNDIESVFHKRKFKPIDTTVAYLNRSSHVEVGLDFVSTILSNGRQSGIKGVGFLPSVMYYRKWGFYGSMSMFFFTDSAYSKKAPIPIINFTAGYYKTLFSKWSIGAAYNRNLALYADTFQRGILNNSFSVSTGFNFWNYITLSAASSVSWSGNLNTHKHFVYLNTSPFVPTVKVSYATYTRYLKQEYAINFLLNLHRDFSFFNILGSKIFSITPEMNLLFGQDNSILLFNREVINDKFFGLLSIEPALSVDWRIRNVNIYAGARLSIPFNQLNTSTNQRVVNPKQYYPYAAAGLRYLFMVKKGALRKKT